MSSYVRRLTEEIASKIKSNVNGETIYELLGADAGQPVGIALAEVYGSSKRHHHDRTKEWYVILSGPSLGTSDFLINGSVELDNTRTALSNFSLVQIEPGTKHKIYNLHAAEISQNYSPTPIRLLAITQPPWTREDHILDE